MISFSNFRHFRLIDCVLMIYSIYIGDPALSSSSFEAPSTRYTYRYGYVSWRQEKGSSFGDEHVVEATQKLKALQVLPSVKLICSLLNKAELECLNKSSEI